MPEVPPPSLPWKRVRLPCLGLSLSLVAGICLSDRRPDLWPVWAAAFLAASAQAALWQRSGPLIFAVFLFGGFWNGIRRDGDQGYHFACDPGAGDHLHLVRFQVQTEPAQGQRNGRSGERFTGRVIALDGAGADFRALSSFHGNGLHEGDLLEAAGRFSRPDVARNPGEMDWRAYYAHRHVFLRFQPVGDVTLLKAASGLGHSVGRFCREFRQALAARLTYGIEDDAETCQLVRGIMFGDRTGMDPELLELLEQTGTLHLFVVDGLKVTFVAGLSWALTRALRAGRRMAGLGVCLLLLGYGLLTGFTPSGLRAGGMCFLLILGSSLERPGAALNSLGATGFLLALADPQFVFETGFQLSFVVVAAVLVAVRPLSHWLARPFALDPFLPPSLASARQRFLQRAARHVCELTAVSVVCWVASLPILVWQFHRVSVSGLVLNVLVVPLGSLMLLTGAASIPIGSVWTALGGYLNNFNWLLAKIFLGILRCSTLMPWDAVNVSFEPPADGECTVLAGGREPVFHLHGGGRDWLLNLGAAAHWRSTLIPYLRFRGVNSLEDVFDRAGVESAPAFLREFHGPKLLRFPLGRGQEPATAVCPLGPGMRLEFRGEPRERLHGRKGPQARWVVFDLGGYRLAWATSSTQAELRDPPAPVDVLVVPRATAAVTAQLVTATRPQLVISAEGQGGEAASGVPCWFLGRTGAISFVPRGPQLFIRAYCGVQCALTKRSR